MSDFKRYQLEQEELLESRSLIIIKLNYAEEAIWTSLNSIKKQNRIKIQQIYFRKIVKIEIYYLLNYVDIKKHFSRLVHNFDK